MDKVVTVAFGFDFWNALVKFCCQSTMFIVFVIAISFPSIAFTGEFVTLKYPIAPLSSGMPWEWNTYLPDQGHLASSIAAFPDPNSHDCIFNGGFCQIPEGYALNKVPWICMPNEAESPKFMK